MKTCCHACRLGLLFVCVCFGGTRVASLSIGNVRSKRTATTKTFVGACGACRIEITIKAYRLSHPCVCARSLKDVHCAPYQTLSTHTHARVFFIKYPRACHSNIMCGIVCEHAVTTINLPANLQQVCVSFLIELLCKCHGILKKLSPCVFRAYFIIYSEHSAYITTGSGCERNSSTLVFFFVDILVCVYVCVSRLAQHGIVRACVLASSRVRVLSVC